MIWHTQVGLNLVRSLILKSLIYAKNLTNRHGYSTLGVARDKLVTSLADSKKECSRIRWFVKRVIIPTGLVSVLIFVYWKVAEPALPFLQSFDIMSVNVDIIVILFLLIGLYVGILIAIQGIGQFVTSYRLRQMYSMTLTVGMTLLLVQIVFSTFILIDSVDIGIIFEIAGFMIYLNPFRERMMILTRGHNHIHDEINDVATKTSAIMFVLVGLVMQLSYLNP